MSRKRTLMLRCPACKKPVNNQDPEFPFCSDRCRLIDLGAWLTEQHKIPDEGGPGEDPMAADAPEES